MKIKVSLSEKLVKHVRCQQHSCHECSSNSLTLLELHLCSLGDSHHRSIDPAYNQYKAYTLRNILQNNWLTQHWSTCQIHLIMYHSSVLQFNFRFKKFQETYGEFDVEENNLNGEKLTDSCNFTIYFGISK